MAKKNRARATSQYRGGQPARKGSASRSERAPLRSLTIPAIIAILVVLGLVVIGAELVFGAIAGSGAQVHSMTSSQLAQELRTKDFTLLNVKTPYVGEIGGTDLWIPYEQLKARASELPADKRTKIVVYCQSGVESAKAAQTLLDLGYTNVWNLEGGMNAWQASGRTLVNKNRT
jgi:rhodanese-related sulfurtransferase